MSEDRTKRLLRYLNDAHAMEAGGLVSLQDIADRVTYPDARRVATDLSAVAKTQMERLASRITALGGTVSGNKTLFNSALAKGNRLTNAFHDQADKETQDIMKAYALSHLEVAAYTSLREYAQAIGDTETVTLAQKLIEEEEQAAVRLYILIPDLAVVPASPRYQSEQGGKSKAAGSGSGGGPLGALTLPALLLGSAALTYYGVEYLRHKGSKEDSRNGGSMDKNAFATTRGDYPSLADASYTPDTTLSAGASLSDTPVVVVDVIEVDIVEVDATDAVGIGSPSKKSSSSSKRSSGSSGSSSGL